MQSLSKMAVLGVLFGVPLSFGGAHYGITQKPAGFIAALIGAVLLLGGVLGFVRVSALRRQLRAHMPEAQRSPVAHLASARKAATLAAYLNGLLVLLGLAGGGWLLVMGGEWGAYENSFGFGALMMGVVLPLGLALAAGTTIPDLLRVVPAGARTGQALYGVFTLVATLMIVRGDGILAKAVGGVIALVALGAIKLLGRCMRQMGGLPARAPAGPSQQPQQPYVPPQPGPYGNGPYNNAPYGNQPYPQPQPPAPPRSRGGLITALVLVLLLVVGGGGFYYAHHTGLIGGSEPSTDVTESAQAAQFGIGGERKPLWTGVIGQSQGPFRAVAGDRVGVRIAGNVLWGYDLKSGRKVWELSDDRGHEICAVAPTTQGNLLAMLVRQGGGDRCGAVSGIDVNTGKELWSRAVMKDDEQQGMRQPEIAFAGDSIVTAGGAGPVVLDARSGKVRWSGAAQRNQDGEALAVAHVKVRGGRVVASYVPELGADTPKLQVFDLRSGKVLDRPELPEAPKTVDGGKRGHARIMGAEPLVVAVDSDGMRDPVYYSRSGKKWVPLRTADVQGKSIRKHEEQDGVVADDTTYVQAFKTDDMTLDVGFDTVVVGFDLKTGAVRWQHALKRDSSEIRFLPGGPRGSVRAVVSAYYTGLQLYAFPLAGGEAVRGGRLALDSDDGDSTSAFGGTFDAAVGAGTLFAVNGLGTAVAGFPVGEK
ncbi:outer membrane protein assembly factor BamB family protein [Streptomyces finlayi]|uniref:outer membrane protein assembly factor BamB family protein n=1 Tax=Streptomyces finlayi TaxID=67296 RepID=UPI001671C14F|nr:PQQ-binding-like beta-propeller repeat protein [Streptomyces finlayi]